VSDRPPLGTPWLKRASLWSLVLGLPLGILLLVLAVGNVDLGAVREGLARADWGWIALAFLAVLLTTLGKVARWRQIFSRAQRPGLLPLARALLVGQMANALLPARIGDVARAYLAGADGHTNTAAALGTIAVEKVSDVVCLMVAGVLAARIAPLPDWVDWTLLGLAGGGLATLLAGLIWSEARLTRWMERRIARLPGGMGMWALGMLERLLSGLQALRDLESVGVLFAWSAAIWLLAASTNICLFRAFDLSLSAGAALFLLLVLHVGVAPPSSPGKLGVFHALVVVGLDLLGVDRVLGLAYGAVLHVLVYLPQIAFGLISLVSVRRSWKSVV